LERKDCEMITPHCDERLEVVHAKDAKNAKERGVDLTLSSWRSSRPWRDAQIFSVQEPAASSLARRDASTSLSMTCQKSGSRLTRFEYPSDYELNRKTSFPIV